MHQIYYTKFLIQDFQSELLNYDLEQSYLIFTFCFFEIKFEIINCNKRTSICAAPQHDPILS
jgi:hypothetical protein